MINHSMNHNIIGWNFFSRNQPSYVAWDAALAASFIIYNLHIYVLENIWQHPLLMVQYDCGVVLNITKVILKILSKSILVLSIIGIIKPNSQNFLQILDCEKISYVK